MVLQWKGKSSGYWLYQKSIGLPCPRTWDLRLSTTPKCDLKKWVHRALACSINLNNQQSACLHSQLLLESKEKLTLQVCKVASRAFKVITSSISWQGSQSQTVTPSSVASWLLKTGQQSPFGWDPKLLQARIMHNFKKWLTSQTFQRQAYL